MVLRNLGRSDIQITPIGLGCWQFSNRVGLAGKFWPSLEDVPSGEIIQASLDGGINWFDTAEMYGHGSSEQCVAEGLLKAGRKPGDVVIATKWYPFFRTASSLLTSIEDRKRYLAPFAIDLYQIHMPASFSSVRTEMKAMARLLGENHIRSAGVSNYSASQMRRAHTALAELGFPLVSNQVQYSLLHRNIEGNGVLETAKELGITIIAYSPLAQGLLTGKFHEKPELIRTRVGWRKYMPSYRASGLAKSAPIIEEVKRIAEVHGASPSQVALNWLVHFHGDTVVAIPGATRLTQAQQNVGALDFELTREELNRLDEVSRRFK
jgi:aryl-alcohol dehydrogenase-like predicted oxidoreductase